MHKKMSKQRLIIALFTVLMPLFAFSQEVDEEYGNIGGEASQLTFPNAFSPNGDGNNDLYQAKTCQNIVEFRATIINRWGLGRHVGRPQCGRRCLLRHRQGQRCRRQGLSYP